MFSAEQKRVWKIRPVVVYQVYKPEPSAFVAANLVGVRHAALRFYPNPWCLSAGGSCSDSSVRSFRVVYQPLYPKP